jgi:ABC-2 type transport system ATP-binding protein
LAPEHTVLLSTHILSEVERTCDRAIVIARGRLVAEGTLEEIRQRRRDSSTLELTVSGDGDRAIEIVREQPGVAGARSSSSAPGGPTDLIVDLASSADELDATDPAGGLAERIVRALTDGNIGVRRIAPARSSLEQVFSELTSDPEPPPASDGRPSPLPPPGDSTEEDEVSA